MKRPFLSVRGLCFQAGLSALLLFATLAIASGFKTEVSNDGGVMVEVTPAQLATGQAPRFEVQLNTHSVPLEQDLTTVSILRDDKGREYKPLAWDGSPPGGHHRRGTLVFPELSGPVTSVTLTIRDVAGVAARDFTWQITP